MTRPPPPQLLVNACVLTRFSQPSRGPGGAFHHKDISSPVSLSARRRAQQTNAGVAFSGATNSREAHHKSRGRWRPDARRLFCRPGSKPEAPLPLFPCPGEAVNRPPHVAPRGFPGRGRAQREDTEAKRGRVGDPRLLLFFHRRRPREAESPFERGARRPKPQRRGSGESAAAWGPSTPRAAVRGYCGACGERLAVPCGSRSAACERSAPRPRRGKKGFGTSAAGTETGIERSHPAQKKDARAGPW